MRLAANLCRLSLPVGLKQKCIRPEKGVVDVFKGAIQRTAQRMNLFRLIAPEQIELGGPDFGIDDVTVAWPSIQASDRFEGGRFSSTRAHR